MDIIWYILDIIYIYIYSFSSISESEYSQSKIPCRCDDFEAGPWSINLLPPVFSIGRVPCQAAWRHMTGARAAREGKAPNFRRSSWYFHGFLWSFRLDFNGISMDLWSMGFSGKIRSQRNQSWISWESLESTVAENEVAPVKIDG